MDDFRFRTEDIRPDELQTFFVSTKLDREIINLLKHLNPIVLEGSRGTGKSFLFKMAEKELDDKFDEDKILPVYITFTKSGLIHIDNDLQQFQHWMLSSICYYLLRALRKKGLLIGTSQATALLSGHQENTETLEQKFSKIHQAYENHYRTNEVIDSSEIPDIQKFRDAVEEICQECRIHRICLLFDEAVHIFRAEQQRQFFTLFRDLRSPYISCKAAVYPGVTSYGPTFQMNHDATLLRIERDILSEEYLASMKELVFKQADNSLQESIGERMELFNIVAYAASGNPRILLKTIAQCKKFQTKEVNLVIKNYYRSDIWTEHTTLGTKYKGHKSIIDWGRKFIEDNVLPSTKDKNERRAEHNESTCYFWIHKDVPEAVKEAMRLLEYTGIVRKQQEGVRATGSEIGTRYEIKLGCVLALENSPLQKSIETAKNLKLSRMTEYGMNNPLFQNLSIDIEKESESALKEMLDRLLEESIDILDLSNRQKEKLKEHNLITLKQVLDTTETQMVETMRYVGEKRARRIRNAAIAEILEYISG